MSPWRRLGIEPGADQSAIRRAYADRLRALDPDADPDAFALLRAARDEALWRARNGEVAGDENEDDLGYDDDTGLGDPLADGPAPSSDPIEPDPERASPWGLSGIDYDAHYDAVRRLLFGSGEGPLPPLDQAELCDHVRTLLADPRLDGIGFRETVERWFAEAIADAGDRADPILGLVVERFDWLADRGRIDQPWAMAHAADRYEVHRLAHRFEDPTQSYHAAWRELTRPGHDRRRVRRGQGNKVRKLLAAIRHEHPGLEEYLVPARVAEWEPKTSEWGASLGGWGDKLGGWFWPAWLAIIVLVQLARFLPDAEPASTPDAIAARPSFEQVADPLLRSFGGDALTLDLVVERNPKLLQLLRTNWNIAEEAGDPPAKYAEGMERLLNARFSAGLETASWENAAAYRRAQLADAEAARGHNAESCDRYFRTGELPDWLREANSAYRSATVAAILLAYKGDPPPASGPGRFTVPGPVMADIARRAKLTRARLDAALDGKGTPATRCAARTAQIESALALPRDEGLPLLRAM